jgi:hypothetical protein
VTTTYVAADAAYQMGKIIGALLFPTVGLVLLIIGLRQRSAARKLPPAAEQPPPGYPPQYAPHGYPGQPGPPGFPPSQGYPVAQPRSRSSGIALIIVGSVLLGLGAFGVLGAVVTSSGIRNSRLAVGDCIGTDAWSRDVKSINDVKRIDCSRTEAVEQLAAKADNSAPCPDGKRDSDSVYDQLFPGSTRLCFQWSLTEGQCYTLTAGNPPVHADCATQTAPTGAIGTVRVVKRVDGSADTSVCPSGTKGVAYPQSARTYCFEAASNG